MRENLHKYMPETPDQFEVPSRPAEVPEHAVFVEGEVNPDLRGEMVIYGVILVIENVEGGAWVWDSKQDNKSFIVAFLERREIDPSRIH